MNSEEVPAELEQFFASYRAAFEGRDAAAIAAHFGDTVHVASDTGSAVRLELTAAGEWQAVVERLLATYRTLDVRRAEIRALAVAAVSPRLVQARVDWALFSQARHPLYEFRALYTLAYGDRVWRIVAIAHDELVQMRPHLSAGSPPSGPRHGTASRGDR